MQEPEKKPLSKNEQKKLLKKANSAEKKEIWLAKKKERKLKMKASKKEKKEEKTRLIQERLDNGETRSEVLSDVMPNRPEKHRLKGDRKKEFLEKLKTSPKVIVDCNFEDNQNYKEQNSLLTQLCHFLCENKMSKNPLNMILTGVGPKLKELLEKRDGYSWPTTIHSEDYLDLFDKQKLVYLTGDSNVTMTEYDKESVYIIGGLVDHNRLKYIT